MGCAHAAVAAQLATTAVGTVAAVAIGVVSLAGLRAIDRAQPDGAVPIDDPWAGYTVFERTATIETLMLTTPSDWYLVNQWPLGAGVATTTEASSSCAVAVEPGGNQAAQQEQCERTSTSGPEAVAEPGPLPMLLLSRTDPGLGASPCLQGGVRLPNDAAMFEVAIDMRVVAQMDAGDGPASPPWPVAFDEQAVTDGPCGSGPLVRFTARAIPVRGVDRVRRRGIR